ncbi:hypothetical protein DHEL01_v205825 [Diaporthe helianthi]|uniref:Uncharacterized protein n=1 Tax=Diaporthe helianthi TaxID=158607 RepID=A0A2P5HZT9_DIAHE|nr:hypothetical protein DHEL01_v205825 [Diaporthe helianthi]
MSNSDSRTKYAYTTIMNAQENNAHQAPEVIGQDYPEAVVPHQQHLQQQHYQQYQQHQQYQQYQQYPSKPEDAQHPPPPGSGPYSAYSGSQLDPTSPRPQNATIGGPAQAPSDGGKKKKGAICGCSTLVFVLCVIIALLSAAVIGLAAGTGVEASRANTADERVAQLSSSLAAATATATGDAPSASSTSFARLDRNCSADPSAVTGTTYDAFSLFGNWSFTIQCNKDAKGGPLIALFAPDFDTCMDHCASYNQYIPNLFGSNDTNTTCGGISFIPLWTPKAEALKGSAPGNCYLKPTQTGDLDTPNIGTECHAAVLNT